MKQQYAVVCHSFEAFILPEVRRGDIIFCALEEGHAGRHHGHKQPAKVHPREVEDVTGRMRSYYEWTDKHEHWIGLERADVPCILGETEEHAARS